MNDAEQFRAACEAQISAWAEVRDRQAGILRGQRSIVLDARGRAYGLLPDGRYKLECPRSNLEGVSHFGAAEADDVRARLATALPELAPFKVMDFQVYAAARLEEAERALGLVEKMISDAPLPAMSKKWIVTAGSGEFVVDAVSGDVISFAVHENADDPEFRERAKSVERFNVAEYRQWFEGAGLPEPESLNWLGIGFWHKDGSYESFEQEWRDDLVEAMGGGAPVEPQAPEL